MSYRN